MSIECKFFSPKYADDEAFWEFVNREFDQTAAGATLEEMAEFAFGGVDEAVLAYERMKAKPRQEKLIKASDETT